MTRADYNKKYYDANKEKILEAKRQRYASDPNYRESILNKARDTRKAARHDGPILIEVGGLKEESLTVADLAEALGKSVSTINHWQGTGTIPDTPFHNSAGHRLYTEGMVQAIRMALAQKTRPSKGDKEFHMMVKAVWQEIGVPI